MTDELSAVRELTDHIATSRREPSLARAWHTIGERQKPRRRPMRRWVPVAAGLAVVLMVTAGWLVLRPSGPSKVLPAEGQELTADKFWAVLRKGAQTAAPTTIPDGSYVYVSETGMGAKVTNDGTPWLIPPPRNRDVWYDPRGMDVVRIVDGQSDTEATSIPGAEPSLTRPTPQWIAKLPTNVDSLRDLLEAQSESMKSDWSTQHGMWEGVAELFHRADLAIPVNVRLTLHDVLAQEQGLTYKRIVVNGIDVYAVARVERDGALQLLFDPMTGRCVGMRSLYLGDDPGAPADRVMSWTLWRQKVVPAVGDK